VRFLADESCDAALIRALRAAGHDVISIAETSLGAIDRVVLELALTDERVLLTRDKDFGELVFSAGATASGVLLIRYPPFARSALPHVVIELAATRETELLTSFVVISPSSVRVTRLPTK
jgi:predicted nuclease of predicted toxin-antitoxin system